MSVDTVNSSDDDPNTPATSRLIRRKQRRRIQREISMMQRTKMSKEVHRILRECDEDPTAINDEEDARTIGHKRRDRRVQQSSSRRSESSKSSESTERMDTGEDDEGELLEPVPEEEEAANNANAGADAYLEDEEGEEVLGGAAMGPRKFVSFNQYVRFRTAMRKKHGYHHIYSTGKLGQLWLMDSYMRNLEIRLKHIRKNFTELRREKRSGFFEAINKRMQKYGRRLGMLTTVPKTFVGSPRYMAHKYQDTIAMINEVGAPSIFATFTGDRNWPEITENLEKGQTWADKPMLAARVFALKFKAFMEDIQKGEKFGKVAAFAYSIEVQKRGMLHAHVLVTLDKSCELDTPEKVDKAKIPEMRDRREDETEEQYQQHLRLKQIVIEKHIHTPCEGNQQAYCRLGCKPHYRKCSKRFPYDFLEETTFNEDGYVQIKRPDDGVEVEKKVNGKTVIADNRHVVPYSPYFLLRYGCHINIECCNTVKAVKYIFKYIFKGVDKALVALSESCAEGDGSALGRPGALTASGHLLKHPDVNIPANALRAIEQRARRDLLAAGIELTSKDDDGVERPTLIYDEARLLREMRVITPAEVAWSILENFITKLSHTVVALSVHLEGQENIYYAKGGEERRARQLATGAPTSQLTAFFKLVREDPDARKLTFFQVPKYYIWHKTKKQWLKRIQDRREKVIPRLYTVNPKNRELFALRLLVKKIKGPRCFEDLYKDKNGQKHKSFQECARAWNLMNDEDEYVHALKEAATYATPVQMRRLYANIIIFTDAINLERLWNKVEMHMLDNNKKPIEQRRLAALAHVDSILKMHGLSLHNIAIFIKDKIEKARNFIDDNARVEVDSQEAGKIVKEMYSTMNKEQKAAFDRLKQAATDRLKHGDKGDYRRHFFLQGAGGCGKTYVYKCFYYYLISKQMNVLSVAHTGIAATLLVNGTTVHRQFAVPLNTDEESECTVPTGSDLEKTLKMTDVVIWDEATMSDKRVYACVDRCLRDVSSSKRPFGGKLMLLGGDWKQLLPIVRGITTRGVVQYTLRKSEYWDNFKKMELKKNMRAKDAGQEFPKFLDSVGRGVQDNEDRNNEIPRNTVTLDPSICAGSEDEVIDWAFGGGVLEDKERAKDVCILTTKNSDSMEINEKVLDMKKGKVVTYTSVDECSEENGLMALDETEYHSKTPSGIPPHKLRLKKGCIVILLRNINVNQGHCNGTRMVVTRLGEHSIECEILTGKGKGEKIVLCKMALEPADKGDPTTCFVRTQFPIRLAYAMTINKSQGQTFQKVGLILRTPVFTHGQLYVALSRVPAKEGLMVYDAQWEEDEETEFVVKNTVFQEAFQD